MPNFKMTLIIVIISVAQAEIMYIIFNVAESNYLSAFKFD